MKYVDYSVAVYIMIIIFSCSSCKNLVVPKQISIVLDKAGDNKKNLQHVIQHYGQNRKDSLKLKAAYFLIENIDGMTTLDTISVTKNEKYFDFISKIDRSGLVFPVLTKGIDSINAQIGGAPPPPEINFINELKHVSSDFLIKNIDSAFYVWKNFPWTKNVSFEDFCEYILPYRCTNTYSADIRDFFLKRYKSLPDSIRTSENMMKVGDFIINDLKPWFKEDPNIVQKYPFLTPIKFSDLLKARVGACNDANSVRVAALRAMGVAAAFDEIPNWGNSNMPHYWYRIIDPKHDTIKSKLTNINNNSKTQHIISSSSYDEPFFEGTPSYIQIAYNRTVPKVYRQSFSKQKGSLAWVAGSDEIPEYFKNVRLKDVTSEYVETSTVKLTLENDTGSKKYAYLCVFDNMRWVPVAWALVNNGKVEFKNVGKNIVYLPAYYEQGQILPAANSFLLNLEGNIESITPEKKTETVKLFTKFPVRTYVIKWESYMVGGRFQLANKENFSDSTTVYRVKTLPFYETEVKLKNPTKARFLLYQFQGQNYLEMSELEFFGLDKKGQEIKLKGTPIGNPGYYPFQLTKLFDSTPYNMYRADTSLPERYVGIDLGENNSASITRIKFMPYTDDNAVHNGDAYKLYYWNNGWSSLGTSKARGKYVQFNDVPKNALLVMKHKEGGIQQRIFMYRDAKQIFW